MAILVSGRDFPKNTESGFLLEAAKVVLAKPSASDLQGRVASTGAEVSENPFLDRLVKEGSVRFFNEEAEPKESSSESDPDIAMVGFHSSSSLSESEDSTKTPCTLRTIISSIFNKLIKR